MNQTKKDTEKRAYLTVFGFVFCRMPTQAVRKRQTALLKKSKGTPILIPGVVNPLMYLEAVDGVDPEGSGAAALFVEAGVEPDIHQSTSAKKAVMNNRYRQILI